MLQRAIDYWCNAFTPEMEQAWDRAIENQGLSIKVHRDGDGFCDAPSMIDRMDTCGFETLVVMASDIEPNAPINSFERVAYRPSEVEDLALNHPGRFVGLWSIDPTTGDDGVQRAESMLAESWCVGLHNHTHSWDRRFDHEDWTPYYRLAAAADVPFVMQAGASGGNFPHECGHPSGIAEPAARHPSVRFVLSHTGAPWTTETIEQARRFDNVFIGTATWSPRRWTDELIDFAAGEGKGKVLYGSGFPTTGHNQMARQIADRVADADVLEWLTATTARNVFTRLNQST